MPRHQFNLDTAFANIQVNQKFDGVDYAEMDPTKLPFPNEMNNNSRSPTSRNNLDWLNGDSIESLQQASAGYTIVAPNSARRMEPIRLSLPRKAHGGGPATQRGRCGKLGDS